MHSALPFAFCCRGEAAWTSAHPWVDTQVYIYMNTLVQVYVSANPLGSRPAALLVGGDRARGREGTLYIYISLSLHSLAWLIVVVVVAVVPVIVIVVGADTQNRSHTPAEVQI